MNLPAISFAAWIEPLRVVRAEGNVIYLKSEHASLEEYVEKIFFSCLKRAVKEICYVECEFAFEKQ